MLYNVPYTESTVVSVQCCLLQPTHTTYPYSTTRYSKHTHTHTLPHTPPSPKHTLAYVLQLQSVLSLNSPHPVISRTNVRNSPLYNAVRNARRLGSLVVCFVSVLSMLARSPVWNTLNKSVSLYVACKLVMISSLTCVYGTCVWCVCMVHVLFTKCQHVLLLPCVRMCVFGLLCHVTVHIAPFCVCTRVPIYLAQKVCIKEITQY